MRVQRRPVSRRSVPITLASTTPLTARSQALQQGNNDGARIYASNAIRKKSEALNLLRLASRIDAVASRVETAVTMRQVTGNMTSVVKGMDKAMDSMNLERVRCIPLI
jgi:charged multivesicular body protein 1